MFTARLGLLLKIILERMVDYFAKLEKVAVTAALAD